MFQKKKVRNTLSPQSIRVDCGARIEFSKAPIGYFKVIDYEIKKFLCLQWFSHIDQLQQVPMFKSHNIILINTPNTPQ